MTYLLLLTLISAPTEYGSGSSSQSAPVFYAHETCEMAKQAWLTQFSGQSNVKALAVCVPRSVSDYGSITLDKKQ